MQKQSIMKRVFSLLLALAMLAGYLPANHAHAASNVDGGLEGQAADVFTALGFDTSVKPEGYDENTVDNPFGRTRVTGTQIWEALVSAENGTATVGSGTGRNGNDKGISEVINTRVSGEMPLKMFATAAADFDSDGLTGEAVYVGFDSVLDPFSAGCNLSMYLYDAKTGEFSDKQDLGYISVGQISGYDSLLEETHDRLYLYAAQNMLQVSSGDYDGDGTYEIAVYVGNRGNARVDIYKWMKTESSNADDWRSMSNWSVVWSYVLSNSSALNMVSLHSADINRDGIDDLSISYGDVRDNSDYYLGGLDYTQNDTATKSTSVILWGDRNNMLQDKYTVNLAAAGLGELARVSTTTGDLDDDGYNEFVVTGQPLADVFLNTSRSVIVYTNDGSGGLVQVYADTFKIIDGYFSEGSWVSGNGGFDDNYFSKPYMKTNAAVFKPQGYDYTFLYLDSCLFEYVEGVVKLKMCLDDENYDGTNVLTRAWLSEEEYTEFGAVAMDLNGTGYQQLYTSYYTADSCLSARQTGDDLPVLTYDIDSGYGGLQGFGGELDCYRKNKTYYVDAAEYEEDEMGALTWTSPETMCPFYVTAVNCDMDTTILEYTGNHTLTYDDPKILAVVAAAPYFEDVDVICGYDYAWQNTTSWSRIEGGGHGTTVQMDLEAGAYVSQGSDFNELEVAALFTMEWSKDTIESTEYTLTFETSQNEDAVAFFSIPTEHYEYVRYEPNENGTYDSACYMVSRPFQAVYQVLTLDYYESIRGEYENLPAIRGEILTSTPGNPSSYPASDSGYDVIAKWNDDPAGVSFGNGSITQEITITKEESESYNLGAAIDTQAGGGYDGDHFSMMAGVTFSLNPSGGWMDFNLEGTSIAGTVTNMPLKFQDYGYYYDWALFSYAGKAGGSTFPVVSYIVDNVSEPPRLPDDFQQDVERTTSSTNVLTWTYEGDYSSFILYKYFDFPVGGGLQEIARFAKGEAPFILKYDKDGKPYREFYYEDTNLAPYSEYQYAIQVERLSEIPPKSAPSDLLTARTKAAVGNPVLTITESDGTNDGIATVYPDKNATLKANVNGPNGEDGPAYYTVIQYQWQKKNNQGKWEDLLNETNQTLSIASAGSSTTGAYRCRVNVITNTDNTAITAYTDDVELKHSKRTSQIQEAYAVDLAGNVKLYAKVVNTHTDSAAVPDGYVTFNFVNTATGATYPVNVPLDSAGVASVVSNNGLPNGQYQVGVSYSGSYVFKSSSTDIYYMVGQEYGYVLEALETVTYGEGTEVIFNEVTVRNGAAEAETVDAKGIVLPSGEVQIIYISSGWIVTDVGTQPTVPSGYTLIQVGDLVEKGQNYLIKFLGNRNPEGDSVPKDWYIRFTPETSGVVKDANWSSPNVRIYIDPDTGYLTKTGTGLYTLAENIPAGTYTILAQSDSGVVAKRQITVAPRPITLQLPTLVKKQDSGAIMGDITYGELAVVSGSWANCDTDTDGNVTGAVAAASVNPGYTNTAGKAYHKDSPLDTCGYYAIAATGTLDNYIVTYRPGSLSVIGGNKPITFGVRPFEGQTVGTLYMVSPDYAYTREDKGMTMQETVGSRVVFTAAPDEGYQVYDWYVDGVAQGITENRFAYVMLNQAVTVEVQFVFKPDTLIFGIAGATEGGTLTCSDGNLTSGSIVIPNSYVIFTAQAKEGYHFKEWRYTELGKGAAYDNEDEGKMSSTFELLMPKTSCSVYAVFERDGYSLTYTDKSGIDGLTAWYWGNLSGDTTAQLEKITVNSGDTVPGDTEIVIQAREGYQLDDNYNFVSTGSQGVADYDQGTYTLILTEDTSVTGYTVRNHYDVTVAFNIQKTFAFCENAQVTLTVDGTEYVYDCTEDNATHSVFGISGGSKVSVSVSYPGYYVFDGWDVNGTLKNAETYTISELGENTVFTLNLTEKPVYKVTLADISGKGTYKVDPPKGAAWEGNVITCHENDPLTIQVTPESGYTVTYWNVTSADSENSWETKASSLKYQFPQLTADYTFTPIFSGTTYHTVSWPTLRYYGVTLTPLEGYLTTVSTGGEFKFTLSGGEDKYEYVTVNGGVFLDEGDAAMRYPYQYAETADGTRVYTILNITGDQEISVSLEEPVRGVNITPAAAEVPAGKTITLKAETYGFEADEYTWFIWVSPRPGVFGQQILQEGPGDTLVYEVPKTPGETVTISLQASNYDNGLDYTFNHVDNEVTITITDAVDTIAVTSGDLTAAEDGSYLVCPITPTGAIGTYDFDALVTMYSGATNADVTWSLWGAQMRGTSIDGNGVLSVSNREYGTNSQLKVIATYTYANGDTDKQEVVIHLCPDAYVATEVVNGIHGTVTQIGYVTDGTTVTVTAAPDENHEVAQWRLNGVAVADNTSNTLTFTAEEMTHYAVSVEFTHYYPEAKHDGTHHWYECSCGDKTQIEEHYDFDKNHFCDKCGCRMSECADENRDHFCDWCGVQMSECADESKNHDCDWCGKMLTVCTDEDKDHICDWCGVPISQCEDANNNHFCDYCKKTLSECADNSLDHNCDICGRVMSTCADDDGNHRCDICSEKLADCVDEDPADHICDVCGETVSECDDDNGDHDCDLCGREDITECADSDPLDHFCDICGEKLTECADADPADHNCDICGEILTQCADADPVDHKCDVCGEVLSECADEDNHLCDICNKELSQCEDTDDDHLCDTCGKTLSECADGDADHYCDICGKHLTPCMDEDGDDYCDICGRELNVHDCADENGDHLCDVCGKPVSECADADSDHLCDTCGKVLSQCADEDPADHNCDICGKPISQCADTNSDHNCDLCGEPVSECADGNQDHKCDICGNELTQCADIDSDHLCDTCHASLSQCADEDPADHACDICGMTLTVCLDYATDHVCDICGAELNVHTDDNNDHFCDETACGKELSTCDDGNDDHNCDICGEALTACADEDKDHICDLCSEIVSECADTEPADHKCDTCGKVLTQCADEDPVDHICDHCGEEMHECADEDSDHLCDHCGYQLTVCVDEETDEDGNTDHLCDICGEENSVCADNDADHNCDVCGVKLTDCTDADDHKCDICGETVSECADADHDDVCDICGAKTNVHFDDNNDHRCDVCALPLSECDDGDNDHKCDICGTVWTACADQDKNHICDICGGHVGIHGNGEGSHVCEYCGEAFSECADGDKDHFCDVCGKEMTVCLDDSKDHLCDICGKTLSECVDEDHDHKCDVCGKQLSECTDEDDDEYCDYCDEAITYAIRITASAGGVVTADKEAAAKGETVTVTAVGAEGKRLTSITVTAEDGSEVYLTDLGDGIYTFIQPRGDVTIEAVFANDLFSISFASMTMANSLDMNFAFKQAYRDDWSGYYAKIEKEYEDGENAVQYIFFEDWKTTTIGGEEYYYVTFTGIAAKEMTDTLYVTIYDAEGMEVSTVWEDSVRAQAMRNLAKANVTAESRTMVVDMLNYGAAAQIRFEYNLDELANGLLSDEQKAFATPSVTYVNTSVHGDNYRANVYLVSNIQFMMAFTGIDQTMTAVVTFTDHYGQPHEITISGIEFTKNGGYYVLTIEETVIADAYQDINCKIYAADGTLVTEATDSVASYAARAKQNTGNDLYEMIMRFATSAYAYLHK